MEDWIIKYWFGARWRRKILELNIDQEAQNEEKEVLEDLIISAINKAITLVKSKSQDKMNSVTGGLASGLKIPGM